MTLTKNNYFSIENKYISNSRINDWLKDKNYFYKKHITGEIENKKTTPMLIGSAVDTWLTGCRKDFENQYIVVSRRNLKNPPIRITELTQTQYNEIVSICESVERQDAYKEMKDHQTQQILTMPMDLGKFEGLCGIPDWFSIKGDKAVITDLKTAEQAKSAIKYHYHCLDYGYYRQMAVYDLLIRHNYPEVKEIEHRHLVVEKDSDDVNKVYTFILSAERVNMEKENILTNILPDIKKETEFAPSNIKWEDAVVIGEINVI
jgi:uncharacterized protein YfkK (UPF0435 family)